MQPDYNPNNKKKLIAFIAGGFTVVLIIVVVTLLFGKVNKEVIDENTFKSDGNKIVMTIDTPSSSEGVNLKKLGVKKLHHVYYTNGELIVNAKMYMEFVSEERVKEVVGSALFKEGVDSGEFKGYRTSGKYIIVDIPSNIYEGQTASDIKASIKMMEKYNNRSTEDLPEDYPEGE